MAFNMRGNPFQRNFGIGISPLKQGDLPKEGVALADQVATRAKVDTELRERNLHTFTGGRGTVNTSTGMTNASVNNAMIDMGV